jgi:DNA invertase Pin-like site-specific DNA recombinase
MGAKRKVQSGTGTAGGARRVVGYVRVSTEKQANEGHSLAAQRAKLAAYCELYGLELVTVHADEGASGSKMSGRPGLEAALADVRSRRADVLLVLKLDRLTRSTRDLGDLLDDAGRRGWALMSVSEQLDTSSASGRLVVGVLGVVAQWEREATAERTASVMRSMAAEGRYTGGRVPYGYRLEEGGRLVVEDAEQVALQAIRELRASGLSLRKVAAVLEERGMLTREGRRWGSSALLNVEAGRLVEVAGGGVPASGHYG